ncbi:hypothetical protein MJO28_010888 [Puccinia striiformis f. sp. tritici]|uniref:rRNA-processing protein FYV7 n=4 Tax=Puccinia striiformis TaxID=27350 RepID=A0A0L0V767_9BASI|nr:hypothetical protein Pst134EA_019699 [Puccinia striiformis f. sp. tritici]KAI9619014.1 hypothetical protein KEM48_006485 [Puccinia striiformis f. sp. tritici PST-130]KNE95118.1 hypothetical protein PSTG_11595 [Puccinia striiformis f. sp. tritici PST-78]POV98553.1 hypothetical protein PSTT_14339 [Puccinia striiformis]KAH9449800.1 hypothetical protein Pst134EB_020613 [Puccinia striiformis f. sp. tritici]KAH9449815.1 hypothetical protein Pst134EB_020625 [Puccinia striiformis f. sp. tritici]
MMVPTKTTGSEQNSSWKRSKGFRIGKNKPGVSQSVYLGKAEKIKKTLIHKAKLKKQRAKELAKAGYNPATDPAPESSTTRTTADESREDVDLDRTDNRRNGRPQSEPRRHSHSGKEHQSSSMYPPTATSTTNKSSFKEDQKDYPRRPSNPSATTHENYDQSSSSSKLPEPLTKKRHQDLHHLSTHFNKTSSSTPKRAPRSKVQHANGQPKLSHRVSKILSKLQDEKEDQSHP